MDLTKYHEIWFILKDYCYRTEGLFGKAYMQSISWRIVEALEYPIKSEKYWLVYANAIYGLFSTGKNP